jgi:hypothetical protein
MVNTTYAEPPVNHRNAFFTKADLRRQIGQNCPAPANR